MGRLYQISSILQLGGVKLLYYRVTDRLFHQKRYFQETYRICKAAKPEDYQRILTLWNGARSGLKVDLDHPTTFIEKLQWMKIYDATELKTRLADKYAGRDWIKEQIGEKYLIPLLGVWDSFDEIPFDELPQSFVLKCNHGSQMNLIVPDKSSLDIPEAKRKFDAWMKTNFAFCFGLEMQYSAIKPRIIAEEYLPQLAEGVQDYKFHCFQGEPELVEIIGARIPGTHQAKEITVSLDWKRYPGDPFCTMSLYDTVPEKPACYEEMLSVAKKLSAQFPYVRVDLYDIDGQVKFGEMTFSPGSGTETVPENFEFTDRIVLPGKTNPGE